MGCTRSAGCSWVLPSCRSLPDVLQGRTDDPGVELFLADAVPLALALLARGHGQHLLKDLGAHLVERRAVEHAPRVDVHVILHLLVERAVGGPLDAGRGLAPEARAASGGE